MRVLVTRPEPAASATADKLRALGHIPIIFPMTKVEPILFELPKLDAISGVIFTSANAVLSLRQFWDDEGSVDRANLLKKPAFTVGKKTEQAAKNLGFINTHCADGDGAQLAHLIVRNFSDEHKRENAEILLLYVTRKDRTPTLEEILNENHIKVHPLISYQVRPNFSQDDFEKLGAQDDIDRVLFYSADSARRFFASVSQSHIQLFASSRYVCLSAPIAANIPVEFSDRIVIAEEPKEHHILKMICN